MASPVTSLYGKRRSCTKTSNLLAICDRSKAFQVSHVAVWEFWFVGVYSKYDTFMMSDAPRGRAVLQVFEEYQKDGDMLCRITECKST